MARLVSWYISTLLQAHGLQQPQETHTFSITRVDNMKVEISCN